MNNRSLAIEISKHPLIKRLLEGKLATSSDIARLVVEELLSEASPEDIKAVRDRINISVKQHDHEYDGIQEAADIVNGLKSDGRYSHDDIEDLTKFLNEKIKQYHPNLASDSTSAEDLGTEAGEAAGTIDPKPDPEGTAAGEEVISQADADEATKAAALKLFIFNTLQSATKDYREEFYEQRLLFQQGLIIKNLINAIKKSLSPDSLAAFEKGGGPEDDPSGGDGGLLDQAGKYFDEKFKEGESFFDKLKSTPKNIEEFAKEKTEELLKSAEEEVKEQAKEQLKKYVEKKFNEKLKDFGIEESLLPEETKPAADDITSLRSDYASFLEVLRLAKSRLATFQKAAEEGRAISAVYKKEFLEVLKQLQSNIATLTTGVQGVIPETLIREDEEEVETPKEEPKPYQQVDSVYDSVTSLLSGVESATEPDDLKGLSGTSTEALSLLQSISHLFPSVNPFRSKEVDFASLEGEFDKAVAELKPFLYKVVDLLKSGTPKGVAVDNSVKALHKFSEDLQRIFGADSEFEHLKPPDSNSPAHQPENGSNDSTEEKEENEGWDLPSWDGIKEFFEKGNEIGEKFKDPKYTPAFKDWPEEGAWMAFRILLKGVIATRFPMLMPLYNKLFESAEDAGRDVGNDSTTIVSGEHFKAAFEKMSDKPLFGLENLKDTFTRMLLDPEKKEKIIDLIKKEFPVPEEEPFTAEEESWFVEEQVANKLKPLIWETIRKNK